MLVTSDSQLVFVQDQQVVTDSLTIAAAFEKGHDKVLRDIRSLKCSDQFRLANFGESSYLNKQKREMPKFIITFDGFAILAMGYSGEKAMHFKERYINEFNRTRHLLESQENTLLAAEQQKIRKTVATIIHSKYSTVSDKARRKYFTKLYCLLKKEFNVMSYRDIPRTKLNEALTFIQQFEDSPNLESHRKELNTYVRG